MTTGGITGLVLTLALLLVVIAAIQPLARRLGLASNVLLAAVGVAIGALAAFLLFTSFTDVFNEAARAVVYLRIDSQTIITVFLPLLLFQTALTIDVRRLLDDIAPILLLAVVAVVVTTAAIGLGLSAIFGVPILGCLLLGAIVATTDPAAVVAIFRDIGAPARLTRLVEGESLLNDATAIALFSVLMAALVTARATGVEEPGSAMLLDAANDLAVGLIGGAVFGLVVGRLVVAGLLLLDDIKAAEATLTLAGAYIIFVVGEYTLGVSGVVAAVVAGLVVSALGRSHVAPENWRHLLNVWEQIAFWAGSMIFVLAALIVPRLMEDVDIYDILTIATLALLALIGRALTLWLLLPVLSMLRLSARVSHSYRAVILWGGLRGAVTLVLALGVVEAPGLSDGLKRFVAVTATGYVLFTLFINGTTLRPLISWLGLDRLSPVGEVLRRQVLALSLTDVRGAVEDAGRRYDVSPTVVREVAQSYARRAEQVSSDTDIETEIADRERLGVGLVALAVRERGLILDLHERRTLSTATVDRLLRLTEALLEGGRNEGRLGYMRVVRTALDFEHGFRVAYWLHRRMRIDRPLARRLANRFEMLLAFRLSIQELRPYVDERIRPMLGRRIAELIADMLDGRARQVAGALDAMRLQYPDYAEALERRFLARMAERHELARYDALAEEGLLDAELHDDLRRGVTAAEARRDALPRLDLGLDTNELMRRLPLFVELGDDMRARVRQLLRPVFVLPRSVIFRAGDKGDGVYFISSGAVEVRIEDRRIRLGRGDFFGEMALLDNRPRSAEIAALGYCQLLFLDAGDFRRLIGGDADLLHKFETIAKARAAQNRSAAT
ncbi:cation:proton antiporter [Tistrella bauzanensis]|uniref:Cation:proton antiporter n=1 Tax=Tistrella arctica TaxID=3133430 RepID=A0ABU9YS46_9PROT